MTTLSIPAIYLAAAKTMLASASDHRDYLRSIHLNNDGHVEASDGAGAIRIGCELLKDLPSSLLLNIQGAIPRKAHIAHLNLLTGTMYFTDINNKPVTQAGVDVLCAFTAKENEYYPPVKRIMPDTLPVPTDFIGMAPALLARLDKIARAMDYKRAFKLTFYGCEEQMRVTIPGYSEITIVLMPSRLL